MPAARVATSLLRNDASSHATSRRTGLAWVAAVALALVTVAPVPAPAQASATWSRNLHVPSAMVYQDPYFTACTAASVMTMLNTIAGRGTGGEGFGWVPFRVKNSAIQAETRDMTSILAFERSRDTLRSTSAGSDAHGWRNALNYYGWGLEAMTDPARMVYQDRAYRSFTGAIKAAVKAIARFGMPVGVLGWAGGHAQVLTGYVVVGEDPAVSDAFVVQSVYLSDPLRRNRILNLRVNIEEPAQRQPCATGSRRTARPTARIATRSAAALLPGSVAASRGPSEWYRRWVLVLPVRNGLPNRTPNPTPTPTTRRRIRRPSRPEPTRRPNPTAEPTAEPTAVPTAVPVPRRRRPQPRRTPRPPEPTARADRPSRRRSPIAAPTLDPQRARLARALTPSPPAAWPSTRPEVTGRQGGQCGPFGRGAGLTAGWTLWAWLHPSARAAASRPPSNLPAPARSSSRASSRASASGRSCGAWPRSSGSPAASATPPGAWRSRRPDPPPRWTPSPVACAPTRRRAPAWSA